jgi:hypothetical protein
VVALALQLAVSLRLPGPAAAGECENVAFAFQANTDVLEIINLDGTLQTVSFFYVLNSGVPVLSSNLPTLLGYERRQITAKDFYDVPVSPTPSFKDSYVRMSSSNRFAVSITHGNLKREIGCFAP